MANLKVVELRFNLPMDAVNDTRFLALLGRCSIPWFGLKLQVSNNPFSVTTDGRKVYWVGCEARGTEAVSWDWIEGKLSLLHALGAVFSVARAFDAENAKPLGNRWVNYLGGDSRMGLRQTA